MSGAGSVANQSPPTFDVTDLAFQRNPWPVYARLRREHPQLPAADGSWYLFRHVDVRFALSARQLAMEHPFRTTRRVFGPSMIDQDGDQHRRLRRIASSSFGSAHLDDLRVAAIEPTVADLLDQIDHDPADLIALLAEKLPVRIIVGMMGLPERDADALYAALATLVDHLDLGVVPLADVLARRTELRDYLDRVISTEAYGDGLVSRFAAAAAAGVITHAAALNNLLMLLAAGTVTTTLAIGNLLTVVLRRPGVYQQLVADPSLIPAAVRESLRLEPPLHIVTRFATTDVTVGEAIVPAGAPVHLCLASANRDEARFPDPDGWNLTRDPRDMLGFGLGPHGCLGSGLALRELEAVLTALVARAPRLEFADGQGTAIQGRLFRGVAALPLQFCPVVTG
ncbi:cytochrome P450 [Streptomyces sp. NPDC053542]|uniref:cytochrome P450 n=1 Tax=Streptomyces sp. NPDC053542 TaxID=3365710 RepID=UPI0037D33461